MADPCDLINLIRVLTRKLDFDALTACQKAAVLDCAHRHSLLGLCSREIPEGEEPLARQSWLAQAVKNMVLFEELKIFEDACRASAVRPVRLKGASLVPRFYSDLGSRHLCDVDVLIEPGELAPAQAVLYDLGYRPEVVVEFVGSRNRQAWYKPLPSGVVASLDVHTQIFWRQPPGLVLGIKHDPLGYWRLDDDLEFLHLILNWIEQDTCISFNKMYDIYLYFLSFGAQHDWLAWLEHVTALGFGRSSRLAFLILQEVFGCKPVVIAKGRLERWAQNRFRTGWLDHPRRNPIAYFAFKHMTKPFTASLHYDCEWLMANLKSHLARRRRRSLST